MKRQLPTPRNLRNLREMHAGDTVIASYVGSTGYPNPHVFCDSGTEYDWEWMCGRLHVVIAVKPGIDARHAMREIFYQTNTLHGYPTLLDVEQRKVACIVWAQPLRLWQATQDSELWRNHFN